MSADRAALGQVFSRVAPRLRRFGARRGLDPTRCDDALQQTFVTAIELRERFESDRSVVLWLFGLFEVEVRRLHRLEGRKPDPERMGRAAPRDPRHLAEAAELGAFVQRAIGDLPSRYRDVVAMSLDDHLTPAEIALRLSASPSTVRVQLHRGLKILRRGLPAGLASGLTVGVLSAPRVEAATITAAGGAAAVTAAGRVSVRWGLAAAATIAVALGTATTLLEARAPEFVPKSGALASAGLAHVAWPVATDVADARRFGEAASGGSEGRTPAQPTDVAAGAEPRAPTPSLSWNPQRPSGPRPSARSEVAAAFDTQRGELITFGGRDRRELGHATTWLRASTGWRQAVGGDGPAGRRRANAVFDTQRGVTRLLGGVDAEGRVLDDHWEWDGERWARGAESGGPGARRGASAAFDPVRGVTLVLGGSPPDANRGAEPDAGLAHFEFDGARWTRRPDDSEGPPARRDAALAWDSARDVLVLFGGRGVDDRPLADTWEFADGVWRAVATAGGPPARSRHAMAFDARLGAVVMHGGFRSGPQADTWAYAAGAWHELTEVEGPSITDHALVADPVRGMLLCVGGTHAAGYLEGVWSLDLRARTDVSALQLDVVGASGVEVRGAARQTWIAVGSGLRGEDVVPDIVIPATRGPDGWRTEIPIHNLQVGARGRSVFAQAFGLSADAPDSSGGVLRSGVIRLFDPVRRR